MRWAVEVVAAIGGVDRIAQGNLVRDDEDPFFGTVQEAAESACVPACGVVQRFSAGKLVVPRVRALPGAVIVERLSFELADVDVVEQCLRLERNGTTRQRDLRRLLRPPETRMDANVEWNVRKLLSQQPRLGPALGGQLDRNGRIAVDPPFVVQRGFAVARDDEQAHSAEPTSALL